MNFNAASLLSLLVVCASFSLAACTTAGSGSDATVPPKFLDVSNPQEDASTKSPLFSQMHKDLRENAHAVTGKEMMDSTRKDREAGVPIGSQIAPAFYIRNDGGPTTGLHVVVAGSAIDQGILEQPQLIISGQNKEGIQKFGGLAEAPKVTAVNGTTQWVVDAPNFQVDPGDQLHVAMNVHAVKLGSAGYVFSISSSKAPNDCLVRHNEEVVVKRP